MIAREVQHDPQYEGDALWAIESYEPLVFADCGNSVVTTLIACENSIARDVDYIMQFVRKLLAGTRPLLALVSAGRVHPHRPNTYVVRTTRGGECFLRCLQLDLDRIIDRYPDIGRFNRYFGIFHEAVMREVPFAGANVPLATAARHDWLSCPDRNLLPNDVLALFVQYSNEAIERIRQMGKSEQFHQWLTAIGRQPQENEERLLSLIEACLAVNHHILVLRFDLGYSQHYCDPERSGEHAISYAQMREHRAAMRRFLKRHLKSRLPPAACKGMAFAIKLEFGLDKGYHFHLMVILNGNVVRKDGAITEMICNYWKSEITRGKGGACNCNQRSYAQKGIGSIRRREVEKLRVLREVVVPYITKTDFYGKMVKPECDRTFWLSQPPKIAVTPKGRKRTVVGEDGVGAGDAEVD